MAIPSGSGTEVLKRATKHANNAANFTILSGTANHIYTIISIICAEESTASGTISIKVNDGSNDIKLVPNLTLGSRESFVFNDKFVLYPGDKLTMNCDWYVSYIDQDWT